MKSIGSLLILAALGFGLSACNVKAKTSPLGLCLVVLRIPKGLRPKHLNPRHLKSWLCSLAITNR